jgi:hypothetical protein
MKRVLLMVLSLLLLSEGIAAAADEASWLTIGGDYRFRYDYLKGSVHEYRQADLTGNPPNQLGFPIPGFNVENNSLMLNRFGLNLKADAMEDVTVKARLLMYKVWGHETATPIQGTSAAPAGFFGDRAMGVNDGTIGHVPSDNALRVDYAYATVSNIFGAPAWFSVGRRPSTGGVPSNIRQNQEKLGTAGIPSIMVDYAFDGLTVGYAPDIDALPGAYAKLCYGKGFDSGFQPTTGASLKDTDFLGLNVALIDSDTFHVELQYQKGWNIFDMPSDGVAGFGTTGPTENLGDIDWIGGVVTSKLGPLNLFASAAMSKTDPNNNTFAGNTTPWGLLWTATIAGGEGPVSTKGYAAYIGARYDMNKTKVGVEYNHGSKNWIGMVPADDDIWTSKLGARGDVYEVYLIQELDRKAISKKARAFVRLGYQYYKFGYTGSNFWIGAPAKISDLSSASPLNQQILTPVDSAKDLYLTFDVQF